VATLDRYVEAMSKQRGEALVFRPGAVPELLAGGVTHPISSRAVSPEQIELLVSEAVGPEALARLAGGRGTFAYQSPFGAVTIQVAPGAGGLHARVLPGTAATTAPPAAATPAQPPAPGTPGAAPAGAAPRSLDELFGQMLDLKASDLHLKSGKVPHVRVDGAMMAVPGRPVLEPSALEALVQPIMPERNRAEFAEGNDTDFAYDLAGRARMRCNVFRDLAGVGAVFRQIPSRILTARDLNLPKAVLDLCQLDKGLVVVTGPTGSGKSTTLAAMVDHINETRDDHLITIEDPVEFVHQDKRCLINHREVGAHTRGFKSALRAALREDPDIVLIGEMRDLETVAIAIETAETGHLVFGTLHTNTAASTIDRIIDQFPADRQAQVRTMLAESLKGVVAQTLLRRRGGGRVAALEILVVTPAVSNLIREGKTFQVGSVIQTGRSLGMQTISDAMIELVKAGTVEPQEAFDRSPVKKEFGLMLTRSGFRGPWSEGAAS
jgi:twitching motility protein PilT